METNTMTNKPNVPTIPNTGNATDQAKSAINQGADAASNTLDRAREGLQQAAETGAATLDRAKETAAQVAHNASDAAAYVGHKAEAATTAFGGALESTGHYLKEDGLRHIAGDLTEVIRRNPMPALLLGVGFGFLLAQASRRS